MRIPLNLQRLRTPRGARILASLCLVGFSSTAFAQYSIPWSQIGGSGMTAPSTGGIYSMVGTIGQPDAGGPFTNGMYSVTGGFWALPTMVQVPGGPVLTAAAGPPGEALISWSPVAPGYVLQETTSLEAPQWSNTPGGSVSPVKVSAGGFQKFYRLLKP